MIFVLDPTATGTSKETLHNPVRRMLGVSCP